MKILPTGRLGKWSAGLTVFALLLLITFFALMFLGIFSFDEGNWWDVTVAIVAPAEILAFILGIVAIAKEKSVLTYFSFMLGSSAVLFILLHSLFIND